MRLPIGGGLFHRCIPRAVHFKLGIRINCVHLAEHPEEERPELPQHPEAFPELLIERRPRDELRLTRRRPVSRWASQQ